MTAQVIVTSSKKSCHSASVLMTIPCILLSGCKKQHVDTNTTVRYRFHGAEVVHIHLYVCIVLYWFIEVCTYVVRISVCVCVWAAWADVDVHARPGNTDMALARVCAACSLSEQLYCANTPPSQLCCHIMCLLRVILHHLLISECYSTHPGGGSPVRRAEDTFWTVEELRDYWAARIMSPIF